MDADQKKTALRMIPYGLYVLTAQDKSGARTAATVNWVTQTSFEPPLVVVGVKSDSHAKTVIGASGSFALISFNPQATAAREALAQTLIRKGDMGAAKEEYEKLREEGTISYQGLYDLGRIYVRTGKPGEGLEAIQHAQRRAEAGLDDLEGPLRTQQQELIQSMELAKADALVVQGRYDEAREVIAQSSSEQAPALLQLLNSDPEAYRESVVLSEIY